MIPDFSDFLIYAGAAILPLSLAEGWLVSLFSKGKISFFPSSFFALIYFGLLYFGLMIYAPEFLSRTGYRFAQDLYFDNALYFIFAAALAWFVKCFFNTVLCRLRGERRSEHRKLFPLIFFFLNFPFLLSGMIPGLNGNWHYTYDLVRIFPAGIEYYANADGQTVRVTQYDYRGETEKNSFPPFSEKDASILLYDPENPKLAPIPIPFDNKEKTTAFGTRVESDPAGGLFLAKKSGELVHVNCQTLATRWEPACFSVLPHSDNILFSVGNRSYLYDAANANLYDFVFSRGRIFAFGIRKTPLAATE